MLPDGRLLVNAEIPTAERMVRSIHVLNADGTVRESWGEEGPLTAPGQSWENRRRVATDPEGRLWTARPNEYVVEEWDPAGRRLGERRLATTWFPRWDSPVMRPDSVRPDPNIVKIWRQGDLLWIATHIADREWRPFRPDADSPGDPTIRGLERNRVWDTRIDVIDIADDRLPATARFDPYLIPGFAGDVFAEYQEGSDLSPRFVIHRPTLTRSRE